MASNEQIDINAGFSKPLKIFIVTLTVVLFSGYTLWIDTGNIGSEKSHLAKGIAAEGKLLFQKYNCQACHQIYGLGGYMGPDLTNVYSAPGKGPVYMATLLKNGTYRMPNFNLDKHAISALISYLATVDSTGNSPLRNYKISWYGSIESQ
jgi:nitric oxide reductase subunit C